MFEVARESNMRTAWCDKHLAYDILNGPSGKGIQDLFTPEINSDAPTLGSTVDWVSNNTLTRQYDGYKVRWRLTVLLLLFFNILIFTFLLFNILFIIINCFFGLSLTITSSIMIVF